MRLWFIRLFGLGIWGVIVSMAIVAFLFEDATEADVTLMYVAFIDFVAIWFIMRGGIRAFRKSG
jgi:hypothetical protein